MIKVTDWSNEKLNGNQQFRNLIGPCLSQSKLTQSISFSARYNNPNVVMHGSIWEYDILYNINQD